MLEAAQRFAHMPGVGIGHGQVLAHDVDTLDVPLIGRLGDLDHSKAGFGIERRAP